MSQKWTNEEFLGYFEEHCRTERALFSGEHVRRLAALAGVDTDVLPGQFVAVHADVALPVIAAARRRLKEMS